MSAAEKLSPLTRTENELVRRYLHWESVRRAKELHLLQVHTSLGYIATHDLKEEIKLVVKEKQRIARAFKSLASRDIQDYL